jgi:flagellar biogenesis protein FliO
MALTFSLAWAGRSMAAPAAPLAGPVDGSAVANARIVAPPPNRSAVDSEAIRHPADGPAGKSPAPASQGLELSRVGFALAIVIALILGLRWGGKKLFGSAVVGHSTRAVQVLARSPISARQSILLVRVGRRVIVVGDNGAQMNPLSEITDPDEIASLVGQLHVERPGYSAGAFGRIFNRATDEMDAVAGEASETNDESVDRSQSGSGNAGFDPAIHETREELTGLMEKIRSLSQKFPGRSA